MNVSQEKVFRRPAGGTEHCEQTFRAWARLSRTVRQTLLLGILFASLGQLFAGPTPEVLKFDSLPAQLSNNAVTQYRRRGSTLIFSFMGIGPKKTWDAVSNAAYSLDAESEKWTVVHPVPGTAGRIAAAAASARDAVFLFGGYVLDAQGGGMTVPDVNVYEPPRDQWLRGADIPQPVGDSVTGVYQNRYIYLIGGRKNADIVPAVQIYDAEKNIWMQGTAIAGTPVFGHSGALLGDTIIYVDGAAKNPSAPTPRYLASDECWMGKISSKDPKQIRWTKLPNHPGGARFRIAAGASEKDNKIYFSGGTDNPYLVDGNGYDGKPAEPSPVTFAFNLHTNKWETVSENTPNPTMDHHGLVVIPEGLVVAGGMESGQQVTARVSIIPKTETKPEKSKPEKNKPEKTK
jgi:N-acetylneuraminic acid mutarotase